jgi:RNA polymerase sigma-70 factor (sigma-E family)
MGQRRSDFDDFVAGSAKRLLGLAYALTGDRSAAEDLLQDVFMRLYGAWPRVDDPYAYARRALVNASRSRWRRRARHPEVRLTDEHDRAAADATDRADERDRLVRAIARLPAGQRAAVVLRFLEDLTESDTAAALGCSIGTVKSQTARALTRLRLLLPDDDRREPTPPSARSIR